LNKNKIIISRKFNLLDFNIDRYLELKKELNMLRCQVKEKKAAFGENYSNLIGEILEFEVLISDLICWNNRRNYQMLLKDFIERKINVNKFEIMFQRLITDDDNRLTKIQDATINQNDPIFSEIESLSDTDYISIKKFINVVEAFYSLLENYNSELFGFECNEYQISENVLLVYVKEFALPGVNWLSKLSGFIKVINSFACKK